jgi:hypothetical protein
MKRAKLISAFILLAILTGCVGVNKLSTDDVITVDVTASYPEKELILQDFMDIEYVALETTDEFITQGIMKAIGKEIILVTNSGTDGDIFVFDRRTGKGLRKINRFGQGNEEYSQISEIIPDEDHNEMFVKDYSARKLLVYDLYGNFKRSFKFADTGYYNFIFNYDWDNLICYRTYLPIDTEESCHLVISKQDGSITRKIQVPFQEIKTPILIMEDLHVTPGFYLTIPYRVNWILTNTSSDTVYLYSPDGNISPFIVRTPSIHSMDPEVFLFPGVLTDRYYFMQTMKKEFDPVKMKGFPTTGLVYDKQENAIFNYTVHNDDFSSKRQVSLNSEPVNHEVATWQSLEAPDLVEAYEKGELKGKLKEIAAGLDEESNPVIMLVKHRK